MMEMLQNFQPADVGRRDHSVDAEVASEIGLRQILARQSCGLTWWNDAV